MKPSEYSAGQPTDLTEAREFEAWAVEQQALKEQARQDPETSGKISEAGEDQWAHERQHRAEAEEQPEKRHPGLAGLEG